MTKSSNKTTRGLACKLVSFRTQEEGAEYIHPCTMDSLQSSITKTAWNIFQQVEGVMYDGYEHGYPDKENPSETDYSTVWLVENKSGRIVEHLTKPKKSHAAFCPWVKNIRNLKCQNNFAIYNIVRLVRRDERRFDSPPRLTQNKTNLCQESVTMLKAFKYRLYPTKAQAEKINQNIGCARLVYNLMLDAKTKHYEATKQTLHITPASFKSDKAFLKSVDSLALANAQLNLEQAYRNFFKNPEHFGFPQFKSKKHSRLSYKTNNQKTKSKDSKCTIFFDDNRLKLPKVGYVKIIEHRQHEGEIKSVVVSHERSGEYYASVLCDVKEPEKLPKTDKHIGIDLGLHDFIVCSYGQRVEAPKFFRKAEEKLAKRQRAFAKTVKDSKNHEKLRIKVAKCHQKIKNQRKDFLQKLSTKLIRENQVISVEDLSVKGMEANHCIAKSVADASFSKFVNMLEYKAEWYGRKLVKIDRYFPSTQLCSGCGFQNKKLRGIKALKVREWTCPECGEIHDRDLNASRNIDREGLRILNRRDDGDSSLTDHHTDGLILSSDVLAREAHHL